ncbi:MAG: MFS transporter [Thauera sp.]|nr:MFS transporter [Thauera sp.]
MSTGSQTPNATAGRSPYQTTWHTHYALAMLALIYVFNYIDRLVISILIEPIKAEFGVSDTQIGLLSGLAFALFYTVFGFPLGRLSDRIGRKPIIALSCIVWSAMTMLCGIATSFAMLLLFRIGVAIGEAGGTPPSVAMVSELYPPERRSRALSVFLMGPSLGAVLGLGLGGWMAQVYGWRTAFLVIGAPGVILGLLMWFTVRAPARPAPTPADASAANESMAQTIRALSATPAFLLIVIAGASAAAMGYAVGTWSPSFLIRTHGMDMKNAGLLLGLAGGFVSTVGTLTCGVVTDRMVVRDKGWQLGVPLIACLLSVPLGLAFFLWPAGNDFALGSFAIPQAFVFYLGFAFFGTWWSVPCFGAITHMFPPARMAQANAIFVMGMGLIGVGFGPLIVGTLSDIFATEHGNEALRYALASSITIYVITSLCLLIAIPAYRRHLRTMAAASN